MLLLFLFNPISWGQGFTNLISNHSFETNLDDWGASSGSMAQDSSDSITGTNSCNITAGFYTDTYKAELSSSICTSISSTGTHYFAVWIKSTGVRISVDLYLYDDASCAGPPDIHTIGVTSDSTWQEIANDVVIAPSTGSFRISIGNTTSNQPIGDSFSFLVDDVRFATESVVAEFTDLPTIFLFILIVGLISFMKVRTS